MNDLTSILDHSPIAMRTILEFTLKGLVIMLIAGMATWVFRHRSAAWRHRLLALSILGLVLVPLVTLFLPNLHVPLISSSILSMDQLSVSESLASGAEGVRGSQDAGSQPVTTLGDPVTGGGIHWSFWAVLGWCLVAILILLWQVAGIASAQGIIRRSASIEGSRWNVILCEVQKGYDSKTDIRLLASDEIKVPVVVGVLRPTLLVPRDTVEWSDELIRSTLLHEIAHLKRHDLLIQLIAQIACILHWLNPLAWVAAQKLFIERERASDDYVLNRGVKASDYAKHLLEASNNLAPARLSPSLNLVAMARGTDFKDRMLSVLDPGARRRPPSPITSVSLGVVVGVCFLFLGALSPWSTPAAAKIASKAEIAAKEASRKGSSKSSHHKEERQYSSKERQAEVSALISMLLNDSCADVREHAAYALGNLGDSRAVPALIRALSDENGLVRDHAAYALGRLEDPRSVPALIQALGDECPEVRSHAAGALGNLEERGAVVPLCVLLLKDPSADVREHAASALGRIGDAGAANALLQAARRDPNAEVREHAVSALANVRD